MDLKFCNSVCRICLKNEKVLVNIFDERLADVIMTVALVKVVFQDGLPQSICNHCVHELNIAVKFKEKCEKSQLKLYGYINSFSNINANLLRNVNFETYNEDNKVTNKITESNTYDDVPSILNSEPDTKSENSNNSSLLKIETQECFTNTSEEPSIYECVTCEKNNLSLTEFQQHICNQIQLNICTYCSKKFESQETYKIHLKTHNESINDDKCSETFTKHLDSEVKENHSSQKSSKNSVHQCEYCGKITKCRTDLLKHMTVHTNERPHKCQQCGKAFRLRSFLVKHMSTHDGVRNQHCFYCSKSFVLKSSLNSHLKTHSGEKKFTCHICNKKFKSSRSLYYHLKLHTDERNFHCNQCEKSFVNKFDLGRHLKLHEKYKQIEDGTYDKTKEQPKQFHQCETCGKFYPSRSDLVKHFRVHSGEKPFKCSYCDKSFTGSSALAVHTRIHTGNKPYKCHFCNQSFAQSSNLKVHIRLHTGDRPYLCSICNKGFNRKRDLETHAKKHLNV